MLVLTAQTVGACDDDFPFLYQSTCTSINMVLSRKLVLTGFEPALRARRSILNYRIWLFLIM